MKKFTVVVRRTIETEVTVEAESEAAIRDDWENNGPICEELLEDLDSSYGVDTDIVEIEERK